MTNIELKACPFCGGAAAVQRFSSRDGVASYSVWCDGCHISTPWMFDQDDAIGAWQAREVIVQPPASDWRALYEETLAQLLICKAGSHNAPEQFLIEYEALAHKAMQSEFDSMNHFATMLADIAAVGRMREFLALRAAHAAKADL